MSVSVMKAASYVIDRRPSLQKHTIRPIMAVLRLWNGGAGIDTAEIKARTGIPEPDVCLIIATDRDRRLRRTQQAA
jgi:hypothetical protein